MPDAANDAARLVRKAQKGDRSAFGRLYHRYAGMVHAIALSSLPSEEIADAVQETFLRALRRLRTLREAEAFGGWISSIARNVVRDVARRRSMMRQDDDEPMQQAMQEQRVEANAALEVIDSLPKAYRNTVTLKVVQGMTGPEIADRTGLSAGSVRVNLHRGMRMLRERLEAAVKKQRARS
jgi:RNA polymerase sigma-70 factor (ECF subfamily)